MSDENSTLEILVVDDDRENLTQLKQLLPDHIDGHGIFWDFTDDFDDALTRLKHRRYDVLVTDIYRDRDSPNKNVEEGDIRARDLVEQIRNHRFCPVVLFTDGQVPDNLTSDPFVSSADKGTPDLIEQLSARIIEMLATGVPLIARRLHDEIDRFGGSYLWGFLTDNWQMLQGNEAALERIIRRRTAIQLDRIDPNIEGHYERENAESADYYIYPPIGTSLRLGELLRHKTSKQFRLVLTPHCFLTIQPGQGAPRADRLLTAKTVPASDIIGERNWPANPAKRVEALRRRTKLPADHVGQPEGRYCFLPNFMDIPDLYCDLMDLESIEYQTISDDFDRIAVLDTPFAEALQACLGKLYGAVGLPILDPTQLAHLTTNEDAN